MLGLDRFADVLRRAERGFAFSLNLRWSLVPRLTNAAAFALRVCLVDPISETEATFGSLCGILSLRSSGPGL